MHLGFREGCGDSQHHAFAVLAAHTDCGEHRAITDTTSDADFDVSSIDDHVGDLGQLPVAPELEGLVQFGC
jgi:hypothetical protein